MKGLKTEKKILKSDPNKYTNNFWILICLIILFGVSVASFLIHFHVKPAYWLANINEQFFNKPFVVDGVSKKFMDIETSGDIDDYIKNYFAEKFLSTNSSESPSVLNDKKILYGPYRIHTLNVKEIGCPNGIDIDDYNGNSLYKFYSNLPLGTQNGVDYNIQCLLYDSSMSSSLSRRNLTSTPAGTFRTASEAKLDYKISGEYHDYNGDGYTWDIYPSKLNKSAFNDEYDTLNDAGFIGEDTVGIIISFITYSKDLDMWSYNLAFLEKNLQGVIYTHFPYSLVFKPGIFL